MRNTNKRQGFTIVELVIVIAVIAILAGVLIPTFSNVIQKAKDSRDQQDALNIYKEQVLALKADNELEDTNNNGKEEVLVVLRENQTDVKYFLFVDGKCIESTADASCDIIVTEEGVSQGNNQGGNQDEQKSFLEIITDITDVNIGDTIILSYIYDDGTIRALSYGDSLLNSVLLADGLETTKENIDSQILMLEINEYDGAWVLHSVDYDKELNATVNDSTLKFTNVQEANMANAKWTLQNNLIFKHTQSEDRYLYFNSNTEKFTNITSITSNMKQVTLIKVNQ